MNEITESIIRKNVDNGFRFPGWRMALAQSESRAFVVENIGYALEDWKNKKIGPIFIEITRTKHLAIWVFEESVDSDTFDTLEPIRMVSLQEGLYPEDMEEALLGLDFVLVSEDPGKMYRLTL